MLTSLLLASALTVGFNLVSFHTQPEYEAYEYETFTPGLYLKYSKDSPWFVDAGVYRNSQGFATVHAGVGYSYQMGKWDASISAGASYGYRDWQAWVRPDGSEFLTYDSPKVKPFVVPSVGYEFAPQWKVRAFLLPAVFNYGDGVSCLSFSVEKRF